METRRFKRQKCIADDDARSRVGLDSSLVVTILSFLNWRDVMKARLVCKSFQTSVQSTRVVELILISDRIGKGLVTLANATPRLQRLELGSSDASTSKVLERAQGFRELRMLWIRFAKPLRSFHLVQEFSLLEELRIWDYEGSAVDLADLATSFRSLRSLCFSDSSGLTGSVRSLDTLPLQRLILHGSWYVTGDLDDLAAMPNLKHLDVHDTRVRGDIRRIDGIAYFPAIKYLDSSEHIWGHRELAKVADAAEVMSARHELAKRMPAGFQLNHRVKLLETSPDWYAGGYHRKIEPPLSIKTVEFGRRQGWRWFSRHGDCNDCDIHWLDPAPSPLDEDFSEYEDMLAADNERYRYFQTYLAPPTRIQYLSRAGAIVRR